MPDRVIIFHVLVKQDPGASAERREDGPVAQRIERHPPKV